MDGPPAGGWVKRLGIAFSAMLAAALVSFHPFDPTLFSLLTPPNGVHNWLGLPGALVGGSLVEALGVAVLLIPVLMGHWILSRLGRPTLWQYAFHCGAVVFLLAVLVGLFGQSPRPTLWGPGVVGWAAANWVRATTGPWIGAVLILAGLGYSATGLIYRVDWPSRIREAGALLRYISSQGYQGCRSATVLGTAIAAGGLLGGARRLEMGIQHLAHVPARIWNRLAVSGVGNNRPLRESIGRRHGWRSWWRGGIQKRLPHRPAEAHQPSRRKPHPAVEDGLDAWFENPAARSKAVASPGVPAAASHHLDSPATPPLSSKLSANNTPHDLPQPLLPEEQAMGNAWQRSAKEYADNLDLDWEDKIYRSKPAHPTRHEWDDDNTQEEAG